MISVWPFPYEEIDEIASNSKAIIVPEMNFGQIAGEIEKIVRDKGKITRVNRIDGCLIRPYEILREIEGVINYG